LADRNVRARIHSAYKPLLSFFRENVDLSNVESVEIHYPVHVNAPANRFRLEAYPLASLVGQSEIKFFAREDDEFYYQVKLTRGGEVETFTVFAPNRVHTDIVGETNVSPTGWIRHADDEVGERLITDYESLFDDTVRAVSQYDWGEEEPYFEELNIRVEYPSDDEPLPVADEVISLREALHEDIYFS